MQITIYNLKTDKSLSKEEAINLAIKKYKISPQNIKDAKLVKKSLDLREKNNPIYVYQFVFEVNNEEKKNKLLKNKNVEFNTSYTEKLDIDQVRSKTRPIVVGFGPAGMFSAYILALAGLKPIVIERGSKVAKRIKDIDEFFETGNFNPNSNVCFGEGGAGTFSDGKLNTNLNDPKIRFILKTFVEFGALENVFYDSKPHVGTDKIRVVVEGIREKIISLGGEFYFDSLVTDIKENLVTFVKDGQILSLKSDNIILAIGHSAKETYEMLYRNGFNLEPKPFSMGVRIEHLQKDINKIQYGEFSNISYAAPYKIAAHLENRDVYTFCMCPGGFVVASNSHKEEVVTNGMSYSSRDALNSNSALLVNVKVSDFYENSPLDGLYFQQKYEKACYNLTNSYKAPTNLVKEFLRDEVATTYRSIKPTYPCGTVFSSFDGLLPSFVIESLKEGIRQIDKRMPGFMNGDAILTAVESRSSSPVRILRDKNYESNISGVYPIGEGAGYAGGITSSALDGIKCSLSIINSLKEESYES